jgi:exodeoxyribonuclease V alpha subunit
MSDKINLDNLNKNTIEFECTPIHCVCNKPDFKIYVVDVDSSKYKLKYNSYGNVSIKGNFHELALFQKYKVSAVEKLDSKYGIGYEVQNIRRDKPIDLESTKAFLKEIITEKQAETLLSIYPDIVNKVMKNDLSDINLDLLHGIGEFTFGKIKDKIITNFFLIELVDKYQGVFTLPMMKKLYEKYSSAKQIENKLKTEPYDSLIACSRIGFVTADKLIQQIDKISKENISKGLEPIIDFGYDILTSKQRQKACIMYILDENESNGHTKMCVKELKSKTSKLTPACAHHFVDIIQNDEDIYFDKASLSIAIMSTYVTELYIAGRMFNGLKIKNVWDIDYEKYMKVNDRLSLTDEQGSMLKCLCENNIMVLNGGGGVGKSQTVASITNMLKDNHKSFILLSPTARAAKVLANYTKCEAMTIHRGLGFKPPNEWRFDKDNKLCQDVVIIDEFGMVDIFLFRRLLDAIDFNRTKLLIVGDSAQLQSIAAGQLLHDFLESKIIPNVNLTKVFRFGEGGIMTIATNIRYNKKFLDDKQNNIITFGKDKSYKFIPTPQEKALTMIKQLYSDLLQKGNEPKDIVVLSAYNKGIYGTTSINQQLQPLANDIKIKESYKFGHTVFYKDDLVMQCKNDYDAERYIEFSDDFSDFLDTRQLLIPNGEIGIVTHILKNGIVVDFEGQKIIRKHEQLKDLKLAYSIGIHKIQGSSAKIVILFTPKAHSYMLNSNILYVGATRATELVYHFGDVPVVNRAVRVKSDTNRKTFLLEMLQNMNNEVVEVDNNKLK